MSTIATQQKRQVSATSESLPVHSTRRLPSDSASPVRNIAPPSASPPPKSSSVPQSIRDASSQPSVKRRALPVDRQHEEQRRAEQRDDRLGQQRRCSVATSGASGPSATASSPGTHPHRDRHGEREEHVALGARQRAERGAIAPRCCRAGVARRRARPAAAPSADSRPARTSIASAIGTAITIQWKNGTRTPASFWSWPSAIRFGDDADRRHDAADRRRPREDQHQRRAEARARRRRVPAWRAERAEHREPDRVEHRGRRRVVDPRRHAGREQRERDAGCAPATRRPHGRARIDQRDAAIEPGRRPSRSPARSRRGTATRSDRRTRRRSRPRAPTPHTHDERRRRAATSPRAAPPRSATRPAPARGSPASRAASGFGAGTGNSEQRGEEQRPERRGRACGARARSAAPPARASRALRGDGLCTARTLRDARVAGQVAPLHRCAATRGGSRCRPQAPIDPERVQGLREARLRRARRRDDLGDDLPRRPPRACTARSPARARSTRAELAARTGLDERWVREWLHQQGAAGVLLHRGEGRFELPPEGVAVLARGEPSRPTASASSRSCRRLIGDRGAAARVVPHRARPPLRRARTGRRARHRARARAVVPRAARAAGAAARAGRRSRCSRRGADVADVGCGAGVALLEMAKAFPRSRFHGYDISQHALARAEANRREAGVAQRDVPRRARRAAARRTAASASSPPSTACTT